VIYLLEETNLINDLEFSKSLNFFLDDVYWEVTLDGEWTVLQFCLMIGITIPYFCYNEKLTIAGNCRMCLVELNNNIVVSCATTLDSGMSIYTNNKRVQWSREGILEFLLVNHPLDCPICDQGGECDLQDISLIFGSDRGRFYDDYKRSIDNLNCCGPLIKTVMTRCIHCTRCVRFLNEVSGVFELGVFGRGLFSEIGTFVESTFMDELSGNIIDLCPVGALTSMPYAFTARPWELISFESIDVLDALGSSIKIDVINNQVARILPSLEESINEEWLSNKARFSYDSLNVQRHFYPRIRLFSKFVVLSWEAIINIFFVFLFSRYYFFFEVICGFFLDIETAFSVKDFFNSLGCSNLNYQHNYDLLFDFRFLYLLNSTIIGLENIYLCFFLGLNLRVESPLLNARLRKSYLSQGCSLLCFSFGLSVDYLSFPVINFSNSLNNFKFFLEGKFFLSKLFLFEDYFSLRLLSFDFLNHDSFSFFLGHSVLSRLDSNFFIDSLNFLFNKFALFSKNCLNIVSNYLGRLSCFEVGVLPNVNSSLFLFERIISNAFLYLVGTDRVINNLIYSDLNFVVYQGSFQESSQLLNFSLIFPVTVYTERLSTYLNIEGKIRRTQKAISCFFFVYSDWEIFRALFFFRSLFYSSNFSILENFFYLVSFFTDLISYSCLFFNKLTVLNEILEPFFFNLLFLNLKVLKIINGLFSYNLGNYYSCDQYTRNSKVMNICSLNLHLFNFSPYF
jgi:NADH-quinone oxidoreductase chain G